MKWAYSIEQKFKAASLLAIVCGIVILTNFLSRQQMDTLGESFSSVLKDRLVVEGYIYEISNHLYQKKLVFQGCTSDDQVDILTQTRFHNKAISNLINLYEETFLTTDEASFLGQLKLNLANLRQLEMEYTQCNDKQAMHADLQLALDQHFALASNNLRQLSHIQMQEGEALNEKSQRIVKGSVIITRLELVILICIGIFIQVIVMSSQPSITHKWQQSSLN